MEKQIISFTANEQALTRNGGECHYSSNKVSYIEAHFELGENWSGYDSVRAVWWTDFVKGISTVLDANGVCIVPSEVLKRKAKVNVNLVGSISADNVLTDRLTSYPIVAVVVDADARVESTETAEITPSQFEQFVEIVHDEVETVTGMTAEATTLPAGSDATASYSDGVLTLGIPRGEQGEAGQDGRDGRDGRDGVDGQDGADGRDGRDGQDGQDGSDGFSPVVTVTTITGGHEVSIEDATQTQTFDVMDGTTPVIPWDDILPSDTASGTIASFPDGTDLLGAKSVLVELEPIQDLHGYDKPWSGGNGKNLLSVGSRVNQTTAQVTYTSDDDFIILNGTKNGGGYANLSTLTLELAAGTYYVRAFNISGTASQTVSIYTNDGSTDVGGNILASTRTLTFEADTTIHFRFLLSYDGTVLTNYKIGIVVSKTNDITEWTPYENICPISGRTGANVTDCGKNLLPYEISKGNGVDGYPPTKVMPLKANQTYTISFASVQNATSWRLGLSLWDSEGNRIYSGSDLSNGSTISRNASGEYYVNGIDGTSLVNTVTPLVDCYGYFFLCIGNTTSTTKAVDAQIELGSTATDYEAYNGHTYTTPLGRTVYGADVEVVGGELTDKMGMVTLNGTESGWTYNSATLGFIRTMDEMKSGNAQNGLSDKFATISNNGSFGVRFGGNNKILYFNHITDNISGVTDVESWKSWLADNPTQVCYPLATPQTYSLTGQEVEILKGANNIWSDGDVTVDYYADIQLYIEKKLG